MPKISALPPNNNPADDDEQPIVDDSIGQTGKWTLAGLRAWLQSLVGWITTAMIGDSQVSSEKLMPTVAFKAYRDGSDQVMTSSTTTKVQLNAESYDYGDDYDPTTNYMFVAPVDGLYHFSGGARIRSGSSGTRTFCNIYKNGVNEISGTDYGSQAVQAIVGGEIELVAGDYVELYAFNTAGTNPGIQQGIQATFMTGYLVGQR